MLLHAKEILRDVTQAVSPMLAAYGIPTLADAEAMVRIVSLLVGIACTVAITVHKIKKG